MPMAESLSWRIRIPTAPCRALCGLLVGLAAVLPAAAQNIESVLRPGDLVQGHAQWEEECAKCHVRFERAAQDRLCMDCHKEVGQDMRDRTGYHGRLKPQACRSCHTDHKGRNARIVLLDKKQFDHSQTDYVLRGKHAKTDCDKCHEPKKKYWQAAHDCNACHRKDDVHKGSLGPKCNDCHTENDWKEAKFDHDKTRFALKGKHADAKCVDCHRKGADYKDAPRTCIGCHKKDDDSAKGHKGLYGERCDSCHGVKAWKPSSFNHDTDTKYALRGKHRGAKCADCHRGHLYKDKLGSACIDCHKKDDDGAKGHKGSLGRDCAACHAESGWKDKVKFDHDKTQFPLLDKHRDVKCADCHKSNNYKEAPKDCIGCHKKDDKHEASLGTQCKDCHNERD
jgi:Cytochrome c3